MSCSSNNFTAGDAFKRSWQVGNMNTAVPPVFVPYDLTGCVVGYGIVSPDPQNSFSVLQVASTDAEPEITITDATTGSIALAVPENITEAWPSGAFKGGLKIVFTDGTSQTVFTEFFIINFQVVENV